MSNPNLARFLKKVDISEGCWIWKAQHESPGKRRLGYGRFWLNGKKFQAHRASWLLHKGYAPPEQMLVLHRCDTPDCVRPDHLFLGTHAENMADMKRKGRSTSGEFHPQARLTRVQAEAIRLETNKSALEIAKDYGVSRSCISHVRSGRSWRTL